MPRLHAVSFALVWVFAAWARADDGPPPVLSPVSEERRAWAEELAKTLGRELKAVHAVKQPAWPATEEQEARPGWGGLLLELDGLVIECRRCADVGTADELFGRHTYQSADARTVIELRGRDIVVLRGPLLDDPSTAARALALAWAPRQKTDGPRAIGALAPGEQLRTFAAFSFQPSGSFYEAGANLLRVARSTEPAATGISWRFLDGDARNHVLVNLSDDLVAEAQLTPSTMTVALGIGAAAQEREKTYLLALLRAAEITLPRPATGFVELIDPSPPAGR